jgi:hypothetical protein
LSVRFPRKASEPFVTAPPSEASSVDTDFKVVLLPAPLAPSSATILPIGTLNDTPRIAKITLL